MEFFGYANEHDDEPTCMVSNVTRDTVQELNALHGFKVDDWFLSSGRCGNVEVHGPYESAEEACKQAKELYGIDKLTTPLIFDF